MGKTNLQTNGIRKAAVFVSSLERSAADLVLEQMAAPRRGPSGRRWSTLARSTPKNSDA